MCKNYLKYVEWHILPTHRIHQTCSFGLLFISIVVGTSEQHRCCNEVKIWLDEPLPQKTKVRLARNPFLTEGWKKVIANDGQYVDY